MTKKIISVLLSVLMIFGTVMSVSAATVYDSENDRYQLKFNDDGKFKIIHLTDIQDDYPMVAASKQFIKEVLAEYRPDLVVLGGDNTVSSEEDKDASIKEICDIFVQAKTYFTLVFGNHDAEQNVEREELWEMYVKYGGQYFLGFDATAEDGSDLSGVGNHNLTVLSSDGTKVVYNIFMLDSNTYTRDENGAGVYDCVHDDQVEWYKSVAKELKKENGGEVVPALVFQHIICNDVLEAGWCKSDISFYSISEYIGKDVKGQSYSAIPKFHKFKDPYIGEMPCAGYYNYGEADEMLKMGDVKAIFSGHDHVNDFSIAITENEDGTGNTLDLVNTAGESFTSYSRIYSRGVKLIELDESDLSTYTTKRISVASMTLKEGSLISECEGGMSKAQAQFAVVLGSVIDTLVDMVQLISSFIATFDVRPLVEDASELVSQGYSSFKADSSEMLDNAGKLTSSFFSSLLG